MDNNSLSRRDLLRLAAAAAVSFGTFPALGAEGPTTQGEIEDLSFICVNDLHYSAKTEEAFFKKMVDKMKAVEPKPKLLVVAGDLVEKGLAEEFDGIKAILAESGMTLKVVCGNHDWASQTDKKAFDKAFPDSLNYTFEMNGWQFVCLDSTNGATNQASKIIQATFDWVDANIEKLDKKKPLIIVTHYPIGPGVRNRMNNGDDLLKRFKDYNLKASFTGHYHANVEAKYEQAMMYTGKCCSVKANNHDGTKEEGFYACVAKKDGTLTRKFVEVAP